MKILDKELTLEEALEKEWIITNGIGGYCSSTILNTNTRKYHGLLVAALTPPARRFLILSKVDESIDVNGVKYDLYTNICKNYISKGYQYLESFEKTYLPIFTYKINDITIKKIICMEYEKNTVCIYYKIENKGETAKLTLAPIINFRDFHCVNFNHQFNFIQSIQNEKVKVLVDGNHETPIYIRVSDGKYVEHDNDIFKDMYYYEEEKRGFPAEENHLVPGVFEIEIPANSEKEVSFIASLEENIDELNAKDVINKEINRLNEIIYSSFLIDFKRESDNLTKEDKEKNELIKKLVIASDNFVVYRPSFRLHTLIAGYPWFLDWGRDSLISFEGILLVTRRYDIAKDIILTLIRNVKFGLVPNGYSGYDNRPLYNSVDSSLLLFEAVEKYLSYTLDYKFIRDYVYESLVKIIESYKGKIDLDDNNIYLDNDNLISSGTEHTQNTWMDAKYGDFAVTPRNGKAVEINSMWYNALKIMEHLATEFGTKQQAKGYFELAEKCKNSFREKFYNKRRKCLYDVIGDDKIRPNQIFSLSLTFPVVDLKSDMAKEILNVIEKKLLNPYGLKSLAKGEEGYIEVYEGDGFKRDMSYHQGITWTWLLGQYHNALKNIILVSNKSQKKEYEIKLNELINETIKTFKKDINENGAIGSISEIYDSKKPYKAKGAFAQSWSVAEVLRIILNK